MDYRTNSDRSSTVPRIHVVEESDERCKEILENRFRGIRHTLNSINSPEHLLQFFFSWRDFENISHLFKKKWYRDRLVHHVVLENGWLPVASLEAAILHKNYSHLPADFATLIADLHEQLRPESPVDLIDATVRHEYFKSLAAIATHFDSPFFTRFVQHHSNATNLLTWIRSRRLNHDVKQFTRHFVPGGTINHDTLSEIYAGDLDDLATVLTATYDERVVAAYEQFLKDGGAWRLEKVLEDYEIRWAHQAQILQNGSEIIAAYYLAKRNAIRTIRLIIDGKINTVSAADIRLIMRELY